MSNFSRLRKVFLLRLNSITKSHFKKQGPVEKVKERDFRSYKQLRPKNDLHIIYSGLAKGTCI